MSDVMSLWTSLDWRQPLWLWLALQPLLLSLVLLWLQRRRYREFADSHLLPWIHVRHRKTLTQRFFSRNTAYIVSWILFSLSLADPRVANETQVAGVAKDLDIMLVFDLSRSMYATDISPSRLQRTKLEAYELLETVKDNNRSRIGVVVYAARPHLFVPLTSDALALRFYLHDLDTLQLPTEGSDAAAAIELARKKLLVFKKATTKQQVILWLTDGDLDQTQLKPLKDNIRQAYDDGIQTYILGVATTEGSAVPQTGGGWVESDGEGVISKLDRVLLQQLARGGGGIFAGVSDDESDWQSLYQQGILSALPFVDSDPRHWQNLYPWFLFPAILLLVIALFPLPLSELSRTKRLSGIVVFLLASHFFFLGLFSPLAYAADTPYSKELSEGVRAYKMKDYSGAKQFFIQSVLKAKTDDKRAIALHNLGNALFQIGDYGNATAVFSDALKYNPQQQLTLNNHQLTSSLYTLLQKRLEKIRLRAAKKKRESANGEGENLFDLPDLPPSTLNTKTKSTLSFSLPALPEADLEVLLKRGLEYLQVIPGEGGNKKIKQLRQHQQAVDQARLYLENLQPGTSNLLWKRLFEIEEGFPAKLDQPKTVPGVQPW